MGRSGAERHEATCHPRLGGAYEAMGLVRVAQAGVAGAALARDGKAVATALARDGKAGATALARDGKAGATALARDGDARSPGRR